MAELYACGSKVKIPLLGLTASLPTNIKKEKRDKGREDVQKGWSVFTIPRRKNLVRELSNSLRFEESVVSIHCPEARTYAESLGDLPLLCHPLKTKSFDTTSPSSQSRDSRQRSRDQGRCGMRGDGNKHMPCHLNTDTDNITRRTRLSSLGESRHTEPVPKTVQWSSGVPHESSVEKWEGLVLGGVSKSTAANLIRRKSKGTGGEEDDDDNKIKENENKIMGKVEGTTVLKVIYFIIIIIIIYYYYYYYYYLLLLY